MRCLWKADVPEKILSAVCYEDLNCAALDSLWEKKKKANKTTTKTQSKTNQNPPPKNHHFISEKNEIKTCHIVSRQIVLLEF